MQEYHNADDRVQLPHRPRPVLRLRPRVQRASSSTPNPAADWMQSRVHSVQVSYLLAMTAATPGSEDTVMEDEVDLDMLDEDAEEALNRHFEVYLQK